MSLLPATSHANPTTPYWAVAGSGGGGGGGPVILLPSVSTSGPLINPYGTYTLFTFPLPDEIAVGDDFIFSATLYINDWDNTNTTFSGNIQYNVYTSDDVTSYNGYANTQFERPDVLGNTLYAENVDVRLTANRGENSTGIQISYQNRTNTQFEFLSIYLNNITFVKVGTGVIQK